MSAFSFPGDSPASPKPKPSVPRSSPIAPLPSAPSQPRLQIPSDEGVVSSVGIGEPTQKRLPAAPPRMGAPAASAEDGQTEEWRGVYEEFAATKQKCGESLDGFSFEKFQNTLKKNRDAIVQRHGVKRVKFSVYVKDGKAALKASPIKE